IEPTFSTPLRYEVGTVIANIDAGGESFFNTGTQHKHPNRFDVAFLEHPVEAPQGREIEDVERRSFQGDPYDPAPTVDAERGLRHPVGHRTQGGRVAAGAQPMYG